MVALFATENSSILAQNSLLGDGFGGRLWYQSYNYSVGSYSGYTVCGENNQLYAWGENSKGQLGDGTKVPRILPTKVVGMADVSYYTAGYYSAAIKKDASGWVWGTNSNIAVKVLDNVKFVCAGAAFTTLVTYDGRVWNLGLNTGGVFGDPALNSNSRHDKPVPMKNINTAVRVSNTSSSNIVLLKDGTVMSVGTGYQGTLGLGNSVLKAQEPQKIEGLENIVDIKSCATFTVALNASGDVYYWGRIIAGGSAEYVPVKLEGLKNIVAISAKNDGYHALFLDKDKNCFGMGHNGWGALGTGDKKTVMKPQKVASEVVEIMAGETFSYIINVNGNLLASGKSHGGSIWLGSSNEQRLTFTKVELPKDPFALCAPKVTQTAQPVRTSICQGDSTFFNGVYLKDSGTYVKTVVNNGKLDTLKILHLEIKPKHEHRIELKLCDGDSVQINGKTYYAPDSLMINYANIYGCDSTVTYLITENTSLDCHPVGLTLPNTFTPNGDGFNDLFSPYGINMTGITSEMKIFTRWGTLVYFDDPLNRSWNGMIRGNKAAEGTYYYQFRYWINNTEQNTIHGVVNLLR